MPIMMGIGLAKNKNPTPALGGKRRKSSAIGYSNLAIHSSEGRSTFAWRERNLHMGY